MKKIQFKALAVLLCTSFVFSSCLGRFALFNSVSDWNQSATSNKFINELIFVGLNIVPIYGIAGLADTFIFNSVEFWTGENPVTASAVQTIDTKNGKVTIEQTKDGYAVNGEDGESMNLCFDEPTQTWSVKANGESHKILSVNGDGTAELYLQNGSTTTVKLNAQGMLAARAATQNTYFACND